MSRPLVFGFVVGLLFGFAAGWIAFGGVDAPLDPYEIRRPDARRPAPGPDRELESDTRLKGSPTPADEPASPRAADVPRLAEALANATEASDWLEVRATLEALGAANTPEADAFLVQAIGDASLSFPEPMGQRFRAWLEDSRVEGVPDAVRRRIPLDVKSLGSSRALVLGDWTRLVGAHGARADVEWLYEEGGHEVGAAACEALLESRGPEAIALARHLVATRYELPQPQYLGPGHLAMAFGLLTDADPLWVRPHLEEELDRRRTGPRIKLPASTALPLFVRTFPCDDAAGAYEKVLEVFRDRLGRKEPYAREALFAARTLAEAGCDVAPLQEVLDWPARTILALAGGTDRTGWNTALLLLQNEELTWTDDAVPALEAALVHAEGYERLRILKKIQEIRRFRREADD